MKSLSKKYQAEKTGKAPVKTFSLSFFSDKENKNFEKYHTKRSLSIIRGSLLLATGLYISFAWLDPMIIPGVDFEFMILRIISCLLFFTAIGLTYTRWGINHLQILMNILVLVAGIALIRMVMVAETAGGYSYYAGLILAIMYAHTLLRIRFIYATLTTWFLILMYALITVAYGKTPFEVLMSNLFFLVSANMMGMFASYWLEYYMKAEYWKEQLLHEKTNELQKEHLRKTNELADARDMQINMLPQQFPGCEKYDFSFSMKPASEVGGDYYDYHLSEDSTLTFGIGDATGHGLKAGIMVTAMKLIFSEHAGNKNLTSFLTHASRSMRLMGFRKLYMNFALGRLYDDDRLELAGAGMPPAIIYRAATRQIEYIPLKGMPLGTSVSYPYQQTDTYINPGDIVMLMTDGLAEAFNDKRKLFGYERIERIFSDMIDASLEQIIDRFYTESENWIGEKPQSDDMTFFIFKRNVVDQTKNLKLFPNFSFPSADIN
jgi:serine phosphatase RsbU (regulator of sigma subunit)